MEVEVADKDADKEDEDEATLKHLLINLISHRSPKRSKKKLTKNMLCSMQKQTTIKLLLLLAPHNQVPPLDGHSRLIKTRRLLVNPKIIHKHLPPRTPTKFAKEILHPTRIFTTLETKNTNQRLKLSFHDWNTKSVTTHATKGVRDSASLGKATPSVILSFSSSHAQTQHSHHIDVMQLQTTLSRSDAKETFVSQ
jgi:hypothetical protein